MQNFEVTLCVNGEDGWSAFQTGKFQLCLVDVMMPKLDGFSFARRVRQRDSEAPLIFLTAKSLKEDKIEGFKIGCDDYLTKPFSMEELMLRIMAVLRRAKPSSKPVELPVMFQIGKFTFDYNRQLLTVGSNQEKLTPKEADLLRLLCVHKNQTLEREVALREIWGDESYFSGRSMDVFISRLRKYLKEDSSVEIMGIHGKGFRLIVS